MNKPTLYASSGTLEGICSMICKFYLRDDVALGAIDDTGRIPRWPVIVGEDVVETVIVEKRARRYRFISTTH